jgi:hypothetical protein
MAEYTLKPTEDDGFWRVEGLKHPLFKTSDVTIFRNPGDSDLDVVSNVVGEYRKVVQQDDVFVTPSGQYQYDGGMLKPHAPVAPVAPEEPAQPNQVTAQTTPATPSPIIQVPVSAVDSKGVQFGGILDLPWPNVTNSQIVAKWDEVSNALSPGNLLTTIKVPGTDQRIILIGYNSDTTQVMIQVG